MRKPSDCALSILLHHALSVCRLGTFSLITVVLTLLLRYLVVRANFAFLFHSFPSGGGLAARTLQHLPTKLMTRCSPVFKPSAAGALPKSPHGRVHPVSLRPAYLHFYSWSSGLSIFSVDSNHMALIMPKEHASKTPKIQAKYHIAFSLINGVRLVEVFVFNAPAHYVKAIGRVAKYNRHKDAGNDKHYV